VRDAERLALTGSPHVTKGQKRRENDRLRKVPYLRVVNVQRGHLDLSEIKEIEATEDEIYALRPVPGDVLLIEGGNRVAEAGRRPAA
jgi:type I restriction enzyme, S subunit